MNHMYTTGIMKHKFVKHSSTKKRVLICLPCHCVLGFLLKSGFACLKKQAFHKNFFFKKLTSDKTEFVQINVQMFEIHVHYIEKLEQTIRRHA